MSSINTMHNIPKFTSMQALHCPGSPALTLTGSKTSDYPGHGPLSQPRRRVARTDLLIRALSGLLANTPRKALATAQ